MSKWKDVKLNHVARDHQGRLWVVLGDVSPNESMEYLNRLPIRGYLDPEAGWEEVRGIIYRESKPSIRHEVRHAEEVKE